LNKGFESKKTMANTTKSKTKTNTETKTTTGTKTGTKTTTKTTTPLLTTGLTGLVGSTFRDAYHDKYEIENLDISHPTRPVDITSYDQVSAAITNHPAQTIIHLAAFTNVTAAFDQTNDTAGIAYKVNVRGTENVAKAAKVSGKHLIHISTAFVFDGKKDSHYTEQDATNPIEWYGKTKALAEEVVVSTLPEKNWSILRIDFPFRSQPFSRPDIARKNIQALKLGYPLFDDHFFGPTYLDDFVKILDFFVQSKTSGLFNCSSGEKWSDYQLGQALIETLELPYTAKAGKLDEYLKTLNRPYQRNTAMDTTKLASILPFTQKSIADSLSTIIIEE
jgi:dTDP-4-dehydrorhamnose reductase